MNKSDRVISVGVSACLLGQDVRYDGDHKRDRYVADILGDFFHFVPICPEIEVGMGVPREPVHLIGDIGSPRMAGTQTGRDWTVCMAKYSRGRVRKPDVSSLCGYILKNNSPSCGMERVKLHGQKSSPTRQAVGLFAAALQNRYPCLPVEEGKRLNAPHRRENFITRVFAYHRIRSVLDGRFRRAEATAFHAANKYLVLAHSPSQCQSLDQTAVALKDYTPAEYRREYTGRFMQALAARSTTKKNVNVLQRIMGFLKKKLTPTEKSDLNRVISEYHHGLVPLVVPLSLVRYYVDKHQIEHMQGQTYLYPHPQELLLRNHV